MLTSGATAQDPVWKAREQSQEAQYAHQKEQEQLEAIRKQLEEDNDKNTGLKHDKPNPMDSTIEGGFGGQEDLEDRYATTSGEH